MLLTNQLKRLQRTLAQLRYRLGLHRFQRPRYRGLVLHLPGQALQSHQPGAGSRGWRKGRLPGIQAPVWTHAQGQRGREREIVVDCLLSCPE